MISEVPETEAHSPELLRKETLVWGSEMILGEMLGCGIGMGSWVIYSFVLPDSVLVWKMRSTPSPSWFLLVLVNESDVVLGWTNLGRQCHASGYQSTARTITSGHHAEFAGRDELGESFDLLFDGSMVEVLGLIRVCWLGAGVGVGEGHFGYGLRKGSLKGDGC